jgi:hypothetical protein
MSIEDGCVSDKESLNPTRGWRLKQSGGGYSAEMITTRAINGTVAPGLDGMKKELLLGKRYRVLLLAALVAALTVPLGFALSVPSNPAASSLDKRPDPIASSLVLSRPVVPSSSSPASPGARQMLESIKLITVGTLLICFGSIARKA